MNRGYVVGCSAIVAAAALGYWIFSDQLLAHRPPPPTLAPAQDNSELPMQRLEVYASRKSGEVIDLGRVYEPTGEELELHNLLHGQPVAELIPAPREAEQELGPMPRLDDRELLHAPRLVANGLPEPAEHVSLPPGAAHFVAEPFAWAIAGFVADWLNRCLPLKGSDLPVKNSMN